MKKIVVYFLNIAKSCICDLKCFFLYSLCLFLLTHATYGGLSSVL